MPRENKNTGSDEVRGVGRRAERGPKGRGQPGRRGLGVREAFAGL